jgi:hypothetical protein
MPTSRTLVVLSSANAVRDLPKMYEIQQLYGLFEAFQGEGWSTLVFRCDRTFDRIYHVLAQQLDLKASLHIDGLRQAPHNNT